MKNFGHVIFSQVFGCKRILSVQVEYYFMSEAVCSYLGLIGLLGKYCSTSKKKNKQLHQKKNKQLHPWGRNVWLYASKANSEVEDWFGFAVDRSVALAQRMI
jgi:hypothetical protein